MKRSRLALIAASSLSAFALAVACGGGDDNKGGDDSSAGDSGQGSDTTVGGGDSAPPVDAGPDSSGPFCNVTPCVVGLGAGGVHTCAVISDGTVRCWGGNQFGALGSGTVIDGGTVTPSISALPIAVPGESNVVKVAGGGFFASDLGYSCALRANKTLYCWGADELGTIGAGGDAATTANPTPQSTLLTNAIDVSAGFATACAVLSSGDVTCWGDNVYAQVSPPGAGVIYASPTVLDTGGTKFTQVSVGYQNACALTDDGHVWCWGAVTGAGGHITDGGVQDQLPAEVPGIDSVTSVATGFVSTCALKTDGSILCFGENTLGLLGRGDAGPLVINPTPQPIAAPAGTKFTQITAHTAGFCALDSSSQVWCWGYNQNGEDGVGTLDSGAVVPTPIDTPIQVPGLNNVDQISTGGMAFHVCALIHGGAVKCWGSDSFDELGYAPPDGGPLVSPTPTTVVF